jgi:hypothetical protein
MIHVVDDQSDGEGACAVRGTGASAGQVAVFSGPEARERACAYARWLNDEVARRRPETGAGRGGVNGSGR